jgi:CO dehydrogenase beta subunit/acetyl-CoA synthase epsilon subunit
MYLKKEYLYEHDEAYKVMPGPAGYIIPAAASMGVELPESGQGLLYGEIVSEEKTMEAVAELLLKATNPTFHPGPLVIWAWNEHAVEKAKAVLRLINEVPNAMIIPMADYRPRYPKVDPEEMINPNHPNLTITHNKEDVCVFVGVHCHYANLTLKMIRAGTSCCTIALCAEQGHEDANLTVRDSDAEKLLRLAEVIKKKRESLGIAPPSAPPTGGYSPVDHKKIAIHTPEEWAAIMKNARS